VIRFENDPAVASKNASVSFLLLAIGALLCLVQVPALPMVTNGPEMVALASNLVHKGFYGNPSPVLDTGPSAQNPPLYPFILAFLMISLKNPYVVTIAAVVGCVLTNALIAAWLPRLSWMFFADLRPGIIAAALWLLSLNLMPGWDVSYTTALLLFFCLFTTATIARENFAGAAILAGLMGGALFLFNPASVLIFSVWMLYLLAWSGKTARQRLGYCGIVLGMASLVASGWMLRNKFVLGGFVARTNFGMTFYASNNDCAQPNLLDDLYSGCYTAHHPAGSVKEAKILVSMGEVKYDRARVHDTLDWIRSHPARFARLTAVRIFYFWFPAPDGPKLQAAVIWLATILSIPGLALMAHRKIRCTVFIIAVLLVYPLMYYVVMSSPRYRYPILWLTLLPAGYFTQWLGALLAPGFRSMPWLRSWGRPERLS
jgi:hypothetical protein